MFFKKKKQEEKIDFETEETRKMNNAIALKYSDYPKTNLADDIKKMTKEAALKKIMEENGIKSVEDLEKNKDKLIKLLNKNEEWQEWSVNQFFNSMSVAAIRKENGELLDWICEEVRQKDILADVYGEYEKNYMFL